MDLWHLAQMNVATALHDMEDSRMAGFVEQLEAINDLADTSPGFVWRLQDESGDATSIKISSDPRLIVNLSVWRSIEELSAFVYKTAHAKVMAERREWFQPAEAAYQALWWIPANALPTPEEGLFRLRCLRENGPAAEAFTFKTSFPQPDAESPQMKLAGVR